MHCVLLMRCVPESIVSECQSGHWIVLAVGGTESLPIAWTFSQLGYWKKKIAPCKLTNNENN